VAADEHFNRTEFGYQLEETARSSQEIVDLSDSADDTGMSPRAYLDLMYGNVRLLMELLTIGIHRQHYVNCCTLKYISRAGIGNCKIIRRVDSERYMANSLCLLMPELQHKTLMESVNSVDASIRRGHGRGTLRSLKTAR